MSSTRIPGPLGNSATLAVDPGTSARVATAPPRTLGLRQPASNASLHEVQVGIQRAWRWVSDPVGVALRDLQALGNDLAAQWQYIERLPAWLRDRVAYELFALGFSHELPKKLLRHYVWGQGVSLRLSLQEMIACNVHINLQRSQAFRDLVVSASKRPGVAVPFDIRLLSAALTNGTLGQFTARTQGTLVAGANGAWAASGTMSFHDTWNFDPKDFDTGGRSLQGELKTRFAHAVLPGKGFTIDSEVTKFAQTQADATVTWAGGAPQAEPDRIAALDVELSKVDP